MISKNQIKYVRQLEQKKFRKAENLFIAEGHKVVGDLLAAGFRPHQLFATQEWLSANPLNSKFLNLTSVVTDEELSRLSLQQHPQQVLGLFNIPKAQPQISARLSRLASPRNLKSQISILKSQSYSTTSKTPATSAPSFEYPIGSASIPSSAAPAPSMPGTPR